jgi:hypothetical protein
MLFLRLLVDTRRTDWIEAAGREIESGPSSNARLEGKVVWRRVLIYDRIVAKCARDP